MRRREDAGLSVAEVLVAVALSAMVIGAAIATVHRAIDVFGVSRTASETDETLQAAVSLVARDFSQAGRGVPLDGIPLPSGAGATAVNRPGPGALTFDAAMMSLPPVVPGGNLGPSVIGPPTDIVNIVYADEALNLRQHPLAAISADGQTVTVDAASNIAGASAVRVGDLIWFSNSLGDALGTVTSLPGGRTIVLAPGDPMNLNQPNAARGTIRRLQSAPGEYPPTTATRVWLVTYYIDNTTDSALPRLVRQINRGTPLAIALGAENLQLSYDFIDGAGNPANRKAVPPGNSPRQIQKVNLYLATRALAKDLRTHEYFRDSIATGMTLASKF